MPTPTITLTLPPAASPPILYPVANCSETFTARRVPCRHDRYTITNADHTTFPLVPGDVVIAGSVGGGVSGGGVSAAAGAARADTSTLCGAGVASTHRLIVTTIIRLQPGNLVYGDTPTDPEQRAKLRAFLQRRAYSCHVGRQLLATRLRHRHLPGLLHRLPRTHPPLRAHDLPGAPGYAAARH